MSMAPVMARRDNQSPEARERERQATRERMRRLREDQSYRDRVNTKRAARDAQRKAQDPDLVLRLRANKKRYFDSRKDDPEFWLKRKAYLEKWKAERREEEEFEAFMARLENEDEEAEC
jgi:hypothetical protein